MAGRECCDGELEDGVTPTLTDKLVVSGRHQCEGTRHMQILKDYLVLL